MVRLTWGHLSKHHPIHHLICHLICHAVLPCRWPTSSHLTSYNSSPLGLPRVGNPAFASFVRCHVPHSLRVTNQRDMVVHPSADTTDHWKELEVIMDA